MFLLFAFAKCRIGGSILYSYGVYGYANEEESSGPNSLSYFRTDTNVVTSGPYVYEDFLINIFSVPAPVFKTADGSKAVVLHVMPFLFVCIRVFYLELFVHFTLKSQRIEFKYSLFVIWLCVCVCYTLSVYFDFLFFINGVIGASVK